jgi:SAM-dependent methyltransferase
MNPGDNAKMRKEYKNANKRLWNHLTEIHIVSRFYDLKGFIKGRSGLNAIELALLGNVAGKTVLHLQCHFGLGTLALARMGARVVGVDFSEVAIQKARELNGVLNLKAGFVLSEIETLGTHLEGKFDIVFASFGVLGWHSDLNKWASVAAHFLKRHGKLCLAEFHPILWMLNDDQSAIKYSYFKKGAICTKEQKSYAASSASPVGTSYCWNHSLGETIAALEAAGLVVSSFREYDYSPYNIFADGIGKNDEYYIKGFKGIIPLVYSLCATPAGDKRRRGRSGNRSPKQ